MHGGGGWTVMVVGEAPQLTADGAERQEEREDAALGRQRAGIAGRRRGSERERVSKPAWWRMCCAACSNLMYGSHG